MSLDLSSTTADKRSEAFNPADHLLGIVQRIMSSRGDVRITLPGRGEIVLFSGRSEYRADVQDMAEFCQAPASLFVVSQIGESDATAHAGSARHVRELLWCAAFHASQGTLVEGCSKYDVVQFRHWPNLTRLPVTQNAARVCALLTRHPTTIMLVHHILGIEKKEVYQIYSAAHSAGIAQRVSGNHESTAVEAPVEAQAEQPRGLFRSLFAKISRL